jgi:hypothetical protein
MCIRGACSLLNVAKERERAPRWSCWPWRGRVLNRVLPKSAEGGFEGKPEFSAAEMTRSQRRRPQSMGSRCSRRSDAQTVAWTWRTRPRSTNPTVNPRHRISRIRPKVRRAGAASERYRGGSLERAKLLDDHQCRSRRGIELRQRARAHCCWRRRVGAPMRSLPRGRRHCADALGDLR